jgi:hypothetical protein
MRVPSGSIFQRLAGIYNGRYGGWSLDREPTARRISCRRKYIDFIARQATVRDVLSGGNGTVGIDQVEGIVDMPPKRGRATVIVAGSAVKSP